MIHVEPLGGKQCNIFPRSSPTSGVLLNLQRILTLSPAECPQIILLTETWLNDGEARSFCLPTFKTATFYARKTQLRGGVSVLLKQKLNYEVIPVQSFECRLELAAVLVTFGGKRIMILVLYRPSNPKNNADFEFFFSETEKILGRLQAIVRKRRIDYFIVGGDFNINILSNSANARRLLQLMSTFNMRLLNDESVTRYNDAGGTQIDLIFAVENDIASFSFVKSNSFSDHESLFVGMRLSEATRGDLIRYERMYTDESVQLFLKYLERQNWRDVAWAEGVNDKCHEFMEIFKRGFLLYFPLRRRIFRANQVGKIAVSATVREQRRELYDLRCLIRGAPDAGFKAALKQREKDKKYAYLRQLRKEIKDEHNKVILKSVNRSKTAWSLINYGISAGPQETAKISLKLNDVLVDDALDVANVLNNSFVVPQPVNLQISLDHLNNLRVPDSMFLTPVGVQEVLHFFKHMVPKKACGVDEVPMFLAKKCAAQIAAPLADIFSASFAQGIYPDIFKKAVVVPIFKKGDRQDPKNYRPISNLPTFSKILENCFLVRVESFFRERNLLPASQHGFLKGRGTQTALFEFMHNLHQSLEKRQRVLGIFYDLSNAFGTICVPTLLAKFELLGARGLALDWLRSALTGRSQCVKLWDVIAGKYKEVLSGFVSVDRGTPQGGIISPFLFDIGIYDMAIFVLIGILLNYADDSSSLISAANNDILFREARASAELMSVYCVNNYLALNASKSVILCFRSSRAKQPMESPYVPINGNSIRCAHMTKFLGLYVCDDLSWKEHGAYVIDKLNSAVFMITSLSSLLDPKYLKMVYYAHAYSLMQYGVIFWGSSKSVLHNVFIAQKRLVRALAGERYWPADVPLCSARPLFERLELLPVFSIYLLEACKFVRKHSHYFRTASVVHSYETRHRNNVYVDTLSLHSPYSCMMRLYNSLPGNVKAEKNYLKFVKILRKFVYARRFYSMDEYLSCS